MHRNIFLLLITFSLTSSAISQEHTLVLTLEETIEQAQYRELEAFSKFSSDLDPITAMALDKGRKNNRLLVQPQYSPVPAGEQVALLYCGTKGLLKDLPIELVDDFSVAFISKMRAFHKDDVLVPLSEGRVDPEIFGIIEKEAASIVAGML